MHNMCVYIYIYIYIYTYDLLHLVNVLTAFPRGGPHSAARALVGGHLQRKCVYTYMYMYVYIYIYIHIYTYTLSICVYIYIYIHIIYIYIVCLLMRRASGPAHWPHEVPDRWPRCW